MICGPGAMTNAIVMMEDADSIEKKIALILGAFVVIVCTYLILYSASKIIKFLGQTGINVMMRLMGLIVMVIAVEFFFAGMKPVLIDIFKSEFYHVCYSQGVAVLGGIKKLILSNHDFLVMMMIVWQGHLYSIKNKK